METKLAKFWRHAVEYLVYAFVFLLPWQTKLVFRPADNNFEEISLYLSFLPLLLALIAFLFSRWPAKSEEIGCRGAICALAALEILALLSLFFAPDKLLAAYRYFTLLSAASLFLVVRLGLQHGNYQDPIFDRIKIAYSFLAAVFLQALLGIYQFLSQSSFACKYLGLAEHDPYSLGTSVIETANGRWLRAYGGLDHPNVLGGVLAIALIIASYILVEKRTVARKKQAWSSALLFLFYFIALYALIFTFSRAAWVALAAGLVAILISLAIKRDKWSVGRQAAIIFFSLAFVAMAIMPFRDLVSTRFDLGARLEQKSLDERAEYLDQSLAVIESHFFTGVGAGNYITNLRQEQGNTKPVWEYQPVHNSFLLFFAENGVFAVLSLLAFVFLIFKDRRTNPSSWGLSAALLVLALCDHWLVSLPFGNLLLFLLLAFV